MNKQSSSRHHFIPEFLIKGFTNEDGLLYVYRKSDDTIIKTLRSPRSIFYEKNRNTVFPGEEIQSSIIEDVFYKALDDESAKTLIQLREGNVNSVFSITEASKLQFFIMNLFWRLPISDNAVQDLIQRANFDVKGTTEEEIKKSDDWNKMLRAGLYSETIKQAQEQYDSSNVWYAQLSEFEEDLFLIGDYPMIFKNTPQKFTDLLVMDLHMAISKNRIFSHSLKPIPSFTKSNFLKYNAEIIAQSKTYVASSNLKLLEGSIEFYKEIMKTDMSLLVKGKLFNGKQNI